MTIAVATFVIVLALVVGAYWVFAMQADERTLVRSFLPMRLRGTPA